ncbi:MAG TPA: hypothetical protein PL155_02985 [Candidatus Omnitrophota bacterium]|nr:hypothetical protein [Candidatus Omnitrophota bacterium]HPD84553.1 hypothetical protein [Candidatus Omnitrophota bacterium]HRZ03411.1 hypothetical protein [Candidatus Omnitrophota bacterium]
MFNFLLFNFFIFSAYYCLSLTLGLGSLSARWIFSCLFWLSQVIFTELVLGISSCLYLPVLILVNFGISLGVLTYSSRKARLFPAIRKDSLDLKAAFQEICSPENKFLLGVIGFVLVWFVLAAYYLPPRGGADDIYYHLPSPYEFIIRHKIELIPVFQFRYQFAFPLNAELLFMWPAIFFHNQKWVDFVQVVVAGTGSLTVYGLARVFGQGRRIAFFVAALFFLSPVVLHQAESNYIDIITNTFFLMGLYFSWQFYHAGKRPFLYAAAVAGGALVGMKYLWVFFWVGLQGFIFPRIRQVRSLDRILYLLIVVMLGGFWYFRNWVVLGNPVYPIDILQKDLGVFFSGQVHGSFFQAAQEFFQKMYMLYWEDLGLGTFNGGYGLVFWGIAFPCWLYVLWQAWRDWRVKRRWVFLFFWAQVIFGFGWILLNPPVEMQWTPRWWIFVVAIGLLAMAEVMRIFQKERLLVSFIRFYSLMGAVLSVMLLSVSVLPNYRLAPVIKDRRQGRVLSEFKYYKNSCWFLPTMRFVAEPLDWLTQTGPGLSCYLAADFSSYWVTNIYGTRFQNRVWNFEKHPTQGPDVYIYQIFENEEIKYIGKKIELPEVVSDPQFILITQTPVSYLFIRESSLNQGDRRERLLRYYEMTFYDILKEARNLRVALKTDVPIIACDFWGYGLRYLEMRGEITNPVFWVPPGFKGEIARKQRAKIIYSVNSPLAGYRSKNVFQKGAGPMRFILYENEL